MSGVTPLTSRPSSPTITPKDTHTSAAETETGERAAASSSNDPQAKNTNTTASNVLRRPSRERLSEATTSKAAAAELTATSTEPLDPAVIDKNLSMVQEAISELRQEAAQKLSEMRATGDPENIEAAQIQIDIMERFGEAGEAHATLLSASEERLAQLDELPFNTGGEAVLQQGPVVPQNPVVHQPPVAPQLPPFATAPPKTWPQSLRDTAVFMLNEALTHLPSYVIGGALAEPIAKKLNKQPAHVQAWVAGGLAGAALTAQLAGLLYTRVTPDRNIVPNPVTDASNLALVATNIGSLTMGATSGNFGVSAGANSRAALTTITQKILRSLYGANTHANPMSKETLKLLLKVGAAGFTAYLLTWTAANAGLGVKRQGHNYYRTTTSGESENHDFLENFGAMILSGAVFTAAEAVTAGADFLIRDRAAAAAGHGPKLPDNSQGVTDPRIQRQLTKTSIGWRNPAKDVVANALAKTKDGIDLNTIFLAAFNTLGETDKIETESGDLATGGLQGLVNASQFAATLIPIYGAAAHNTDAALQYAQNSNLKKKIWDLM